MFVGGGGSGVFVGGGVLVGGTSQSVVPQKIAPPAVPAIVLPSEAETAVSHCIQPQFLEVLRD